MNAHLLEPEVQRYLQAHETAAPTSIALRKSPFPNVTATELAQQLDGRQRSRKKLPTWHHTSGIYYPEKLSIEQTSSEATAVYKSELIPEQSRVIDLTGGFGVDTYYFAKRASEVVHCERNGLLSEIAKHNAIVLGATNIDFVVTDGPSYLHNQAENAFDCIYIDPSRRADSRRVFLLEDCEPNVVELQDWLLLKSPQVFVKSAPLLDISSALKALNHVSEVHIVSVDNECKELLFVLDREYTGSPVITATMLRNERRNRSFAFHVEEAPSATSEFSYPQQYLYEPDAALMKTGAFKLIGQRYGMDKLHQHTHLYTSSLVNPDFMGRIFQVDQVMSYADFKKRKDTMQANVTARNFPLKPEELRKKHRIREGGDRYLFFCTGVNDTLLVIFASKSP